MSVIRGYRQLPWDDEMVPLDVENWLPAVMSCVDQIEVERSGSQKEIKLGTGMMMPDGR